MGILTLSLGLAGSNCVLKFQSVGCPLASSRTVKGFKPCIVNEEVGMQLWLEAAKEDAAVEDQLDGLRKRAKTRNNTSSMYP